MTYSVDNTRRNPIYEKSLLRQLLPATLLPGGFFEVQKRADFGDVF